MDDEDFYSSSRKAASKSSSKRRRPPARPHSMSSRYGSVSVNDDMSTNRPKKKSNKLRRRSTVRRRHRVQDYTDEYHDSADNGHDSASTNTLQSGPDEDEDDEEADEDELEEQDTHRSRLVPTDADSDRSSFNSIERKNTLKDRQDAINKQHPFGLPLWKPALYKKSRSVVRRANNALHSSPSSSPELFLNPGNILWLLLFGWWLALIVLIVSIPVCIIPPDGRIYGLVLRELSFYLLWPFGRYVERVVQIEPTQLEEQTNASTEDDNDEEACLLQQQKSKRQGRPLKLKWLRAIVDTIKTGPTGCVYYLFFFTIIAPVLMLVSAICWMCVITIPMAKLNYILVRHLRRHPLSLRFRSTSSSQTHFAPVGRHQPTVILLCTYQAFGLQYYKYTYDGINIMFINLLPIVFFVILDDYILKDRWPESIIAAPSFVFAMSLASVIPLSYFIGMGVSSVSAQSSMGVGAVINATFGSIIEIILYAVALMSGKSALVEGSLIGSILAGVLLMPGMSMISGGVKRKEQKFNAKSAGVTSTMLIMAIIGALSPTLFYQMFGSFELRCTGCPESPAPGGTMSCTRCYYDQMNPTIDPVYQNSVKPLMWLCAAILPSAYIIGLVFSLHTHVDMVWKSEPPKSSANNQKMSETAPTHHQKLIPTHIISQLMHTNPTSTTYQRPQGVSEPSLSIYRVSDHPSTAGESSTDAVASVSKQHQQQQPLTAIHSVVASQSPPMEAYIHVKEPEEDEDEEEAAGHDSPNWSKSKSFTILFGCTLLYSLIAEILVDTVDEVMEGMTIDAKFLGLTLFALVPNITEFMNAISFALYGNVVLSMEIGSAYALQVCLLQIPAMVAFSLYYNWGKEEIARYTFSLIFPRWDVISVIFSVFLLTYTYQEGKSNYFKGSILILTYFVLVAGFYFVPSVSDATVLTTTVMAR
ncbi:Sodium/calcium exchanger protein-domain-containing protein [Radiomyces spectabilis]|uniref:Sodium/calcium exchanger protein-domain-containing protein n=1 Tax=Radiomyces spectabilis TaxID=64574 RepID=UPI00221FDFAC|nr:Sodium/calcium exchanger protein-domain-containing protein [Radiomyces spectabilis]KAI8379314.1 Sodium/calcium exchanger protein-domain-containing protein [Radiomyces spectabilis]